MKGNELERWRELCAEIAEEQDGARFSELVTELLQELEKKRERINSRVGDTAAD